MDMFWFWFSSLCYYYYVAALSTVAVVAVIVAATQRANATRRYRLHILALTGWRWLAGGLVDWLTGLVVCVHTIRIRCFILFSTLFVRWRSLMRYYAIARSVFSYEIQSYLISHWTFRENSLCLTLNEDGCVLYYFSLMILFSYHRNSTRSASIQFVYSETYLTVAKNKRKK